MVTVFVIVRVVILPRAVASIPAVLAIRDAVVQSDVIVGAGRNSDEEPEKRRDLSISSQKYVSK